MFLQQSAEAIDSRGLSLHSGVQECRESAQDYDLSGVSFPVFCSKRVESGGINRPQNYPRVSVPQYRKKSRKKCWGYELGCRVGGRMLGFGASLLGWMWLEGEAGE